MRQRNKQINIRVTEKDRTKNIKLAAKSKCKSLTDYILDKALNKEIIQYDLHEINAINARLSKLGGELNHLVMLCHQGKIKLVNLTKYTKELEELQEALKNIK